MKSNTFDGVIHGVAAIPILLAMGATYVFGLLPQHQAAKRLDHAERSLQDQLQRVTKVRDQAVKIRAEVKTAEERLAGKRRRENPNLPTAQEVLDALATPSSDQPISLQEWTRVEPTVMRGCITSFARLEGSYAGCCMALDHLRALPHQPLIHSMVVRQTGQGRVAVELTVLCREPAKPTGEGS